MADNNIDIAVLNDAIENASEMLNEFGATINQSGSRFRNSLTVTENEVASITKANAQKRDEILRSSVTSTVSTFKDLSNSFTQSKGSFTALNPVIDLTTKVIGGLASKIPIVGGLLQGMAEGTGEAMKFLTTEFEKAYTTFETLSGSGVIQTFEDLQKGSLSLGLTFADQQRVLGAFSKDLALLGGSAISGRQEFQKIAVQSEEARRNFQKLGISSAEFSEFQLSYISQQTRLGLGQTKTTAQLAEGSQQYLRELDLLSKATGANRKDLQAQRDAALSETRFRASLDQMQNEKTKEAAQQLNLMIQQQSPALAQGFRDLMSGAVTSDAAKSAVLQSGGAVQEIVEKLKNGTIDQFEADRQLREAVGKTAKEFGTAAQFVGDANLATMNYAQLMDYASKKGLTPEQVDKLKKEQEKTLENEKGQNAELAKARQALYQTSINMESLVTSSELATNAINFMAEAVEAISEKMYEYSGQEMPPLLKAKREERQALQEEKKAREELIAAKKADEERQANLSPEEATDTGTATYSQAAEAKLAQKSAALQQARAARIQTSMAEGSQTAAMNQSDLKAMGLRIKEGDVQAEGSRLHSSTINLAKAVQGQLAGFNYFSGFNDKFHQEKSPSSDHTTGKAFDFTLNYTPSKEQGQEIINQLKGLGAVYVQDEYNNPSSKATAGHFHVKALAKGGIVSPTPGGSLIQVAEGGQSEAVIPMPDGRSVPVTFKNSNEQTNMLSSAFDKMADKLDTMIDLLNKGNKMQNSIVRNTA